MRLAHLLLPCLFLAGASGCHDDDCDCDPVEPSFDEREPNDLPAEANHFGTVRPGDVFLIEGSVRDDLSDPFDGFAFTAGEQLHVDFELYIHESADLDVCLYDPQIDETVACFATASDPEVGGVDVFAAGLDFHLVVESFTGNSSYTLRIVVLPLFGRAPLPEDGTSSLRGTGAVREHATRAPAGYVEPQPAPRLVLERELEIDHDRGLVLERLRVLSR